MDDVDAQRRHQLFVISTVISGSYRVVFFWQGNVCSFLEGAVLGSEQLHPSFEKQTENSPTWKTSSPFVIQNLSMPAFTDKTSWLYV